MTRPTRLVLGLVLAALAGCGGDDPAPAAGAGPQPVPGAKLALRTFSGAGACDALEAYAADVFTAQFLDGLDCHAFAPCPVFLGAPDTVGGGTTGGTGGAPTSGEGAPTPGRVSQTNTQEAGVDEADLVETDADGNLYVLTERRLVVLDAFPPAGLAERPQAELDLSGGDAGFHATGLMLDEPAARLVAFGYSAGAERGRAVAVIVDVADPAAPVELARLAVDGWPIEARRVGPRVHRVSRFEVPLPSAIWGDSELQARRNDYQRARAERRETDALAIEQAVRATIGGIVDGIGAAALLPRKQSPGAAAQPIACSDVAYAEVPTGLGFAVLDSFDTNGARHAASAAVNNAFLVYASAANLYLAQSSLGWFFAPEQVEESAIYRFALSADGAPAYAGFGRVPGVPLNGYAFSEHEGFLRVAATASEVVDGVRRSESRLHVLRASGSELAPVGAAGPFAPDEFIRGSRFMGTRGFVVTFRQVDPLFAFDLSDPAQPRIVDELKVPGFSSYLMPLGSDHLLTIGRAGDEQQLTGRVAVQLFDVSDLADIRAVGLVEPGFGDGAYSWSVAEYDPHAFSYFPDSATAATPGRLSIPVQVYSANESFSGFLLLRVDPAAAIPLGELARIDHADLVADNPCAGEGADTPCREPVYAAEPRRSLFMQDEAGTYLYSLSPVGVLAHATEPPYAELGRALLPYDTPQCCYIEPAGGGTTGP